MARQPRTRQPKIKYKTEITCAVCLVLTSEFVIVTGPQGPMMAHENTDLCNSLYDGRQARKARVRTKR